MKIKRLKKSERLPQRLCCSDRPSDVGKSTLINALVGEKVSITSKKPQTTRDRIMGVLTTDNAQYLFVDTPGFQTKHSSELLARMNQSVRSSLSDVDAVVMVIEPPAGVLKIRLS